MVAFLNIKYYLRFPAPTEENKETALSIACLSAQHGLKDVSYTKQECKALKHNC
jgi:hypothetical protein